jgi:rod shape determining protein RodA
MLAQKELTYILVGIICFFVTFITPIRKLSWLIPIFYWINIGLLILVDFIGISKLGAKRWLEIPFVHFTIQPSELFKTAFILMLAYLIHNNPPAKNGYNLKEFLKISFYIILPFFLIAKEPDLGTATVLLLVGMGILVIVGVNWKIWVGIIVTLVLCAPLIYQNLHNYQKQRIRDFLNEKPSYHVQQSIIAIGNGGLTGKPKDEATQAQLKFLPIATSDFIFASLCERFGFSGGIGILTLYALLVLHLISLNFLPNVDYFIKVFSTAISILIFVYTSVNIAMTIGFAPVVGVPLPFFSYGGSSFINFMILFGILQNLLAFRFNFLYNSTNKIQYR